MKKISLLLLLSLLWGCRAKQEITPLIVGDWLWTGSDGGIGGRIIRPLANQRTLLRFTNQSTFSIVRNDTLLISGAYKLGTGQSIYTGKEAQTIETSNVVMNNEAGNQISFFRFGALINSLNQSGLSIGDNMYDGYGSGFRRQ